MVTFVLIVAVCLFVVVAYIAVVLQNVQHGLWHAHPFMQLQGTEAIEGKDKGEKHGAHCRAAKVVRVRWVEW